MIDPILLSAGIYASILGLMAAGLTLTYMTTKVPNFAYGSFVAIGVYITFALAKINHLDSYSSIPYAFALGGIASLLVYALVLRPLIRRGASLVAQMIATFAVDTIFVGIIGVYSDYLRFRYKIAESYVFPPVGGDFTLFGIAGRFYTAPIALMLVTVGLYLLLNRTKFGIAMRAAVENASLAKIVGINVERVYLISWVLAGGLAGIAGSFYGVEFGGSTDVGTLVIVSIFAASVVGGLTNVYGAVLGGVLVGGSEIIVTSYGAQLLGSWFIAYQKAIPLVAMVAALLIIPQGLSSINIKRYLRRGQCR